MSADDHGPSRWSHSTSEKSGVPSYAAETQDQSEARSSDNYSGVEELATVAVVGKPANLALIMSSGQKARERAKASDGPNESLPPPSPKGNFLSLVLSSGHHTREDRARRRVIESRDERAVKDNSENAGEGNAKDAEGGGEDFVAQK
ncbi:hypothetical protein TOPH_02890 [Tolypocladium ophioglossoides CBS 100239]|uniref:Uncharacterized protein n=1 Tax=Tolypocladium ophioglossoides (strain CBS 100239) TaxID=1163406 RepID=A0A0L0NET2_TOLOC|nr:hypothetical protein TOPH_02890 [Tolypocladium ophioglossoides CBS 100239]